MDLLLGTDSRPLGTGLDGTTGTTGAPDAARIPNAPGTGETPPSAGPLAGVIPPGFAGRVNLTIPATTVLDLADRPGELAGIGPIDPEPGANTSDCYRSQVRADPRLIATVLRWSKATLWGEPTVRWRRAIVRSG
jgi:hypothetical protein